LVVDALRHNPNPTGIVMETVVQKAQKSRRAFARQVDALNQSTVGAAATFARQSQQGCASFGGYLVREAHSWGKFAGDRRESLSWDSRPSPRTIERALLELVAQATGQLHSQIQSRLEALDGVQTLPLRDYETMTARSIVSELDALTQSQCQALLDFEHTNKKRTTVMRALQQRLAD